MWQLDNRTPFAAERTWVRDHYGAEIWLVAVKCTFDIQPNGTTEIAAEQPPVTMAPEYFGEPAKSSLKYDSDLLLTKKTTDILLHGHAYAPKGYLAKVVDVGLRVGPVTKVLRVYGDRYWNPENGLPYSEPEPFSKMPIVYERAYGGADPALKGDEPGSWDWRNPVGTGFATSSSHLAGVRLPNVEYPTALIQSRGDRPEPAGFGPICSHWQPRVRYAGTYDDHWQQTRMPLYPEDFDERFFQCAPADQQAPAFLRGGEPVALRGLSAQGDLRFHLPRVFLGFETFFYDGERRLHEPPKLHSVILEPDFPRVSLVFHTALPCHPKVRKLKETRIYVKQPIGTREESIDTAEEVF